MTAASADGSAAEPAVHEELFHLDRIIGYMSATSDASWNTDTVRSKDGERNCFFGHLFAMAPDDKTGTQLWDWFEQTWATTYMVYPINDGEHPNYQQPEPKQRILAYLSDLRDGKTPTTPMYEDMYEQMMTSDG